MAGRKPIPGDSGTPPSAWWRHPIMWMVVGGPAVVVVAGIVTAVIATRGADPVLDTRVADQAAVPAVQARNHAATPPRQP